MSEYKMFEDQSIFQDILEFNTPAGMIKAEDGEGGIYKIFENNGNTWIFKGRSIISKTDQAKEGVSLNEAIWHNYFTAND